MSDQDKELAMDEVTFASVDKDKEQCTQTPFDEEPMLDEMQYYPKSDRIGDLDDLGHGLSPEERAEI